MTKQILFLFLLFSSLVSVAKNEHPKWVAHPQAQSDTLIGNTLYKLEFKLKDSVKVAICKVAATNTFSLWINSVPVIFNGMASTDTANAKVTLVNIAPYLTEGVNAISACLFPCPPYEKTTSMFWLNVSINDFQLVSDKNIISYRDYSNNFVLSKTNEDSCLLFNTTPKTSIVGDWKTPEFNHKKLSPKKWQKTIEHLAFVPKPSINTHLPKTFSKNKAVTNLEFPLSIRTPELIRATLDDSTPVLVEITLESMKDKVIEMYTPEMRLKEQSYTYTTTFGLQKITFPILIRSKELLIDINEPIKILSINYRSIDD